jgi:DNA (cytosine-5)-methyltransferase 1
LRHSAGVDGGVRAPLSVGSLFAGIGGIDLGLERTGGFKTAWFSEIDPFANAVLRKHWPDVPNLGDVRNLGDRTPRVDLIAGGFPCQPVSLAGKRLAQEDPRWLWPYVADVVRALRPRVVLLENVPGLRSKGLGDVLEDLSALGYDAEWDGIPASAVGAPHRRDRVWIVAYPDGHGHGREVESQPDSEAQTGGEVQLRDDANRLRDSVSDAQGVGWDGGGTAMEGPRVFPRQSDGEGRAHGRAQWSLEPSVDRVVDGFPGRVAEVRALGNAVVPQVAEVVGHLILDAVKAGRI